MQRLLSLFSIAFGMELTSEFTSRSVCYDDWKVPLQRIDDKKKQLFDDLGPFDVRLMRMGTLNPRFLEFMLIKSR
jgi:hypothetical protein